MASSEWSGPLPPPGCSRSAYGTQMGAYDPVRLRRKWAIGRHRCRNFALASTGGQLGRSAAPCCSDCSSLTAPFLLQLRSEAATFAHTDMWMLIGFVSSPSLSSPWISPLLSSQPLPSSPLPPSPLLSVNLFPSRRCNYECGFCFHTAKNGRELTLAEAKAGLRLLAAAGTEKVNIAGGEPFMRPDFLGKLVSACADLGLKVTIISNGSLIRRAWMEEHGRHVRR